jgi:hypothetical protein
VSEHPKCRDVLDDIEKRRQKDSNGSYELAPLGDNVRLHRLVRRDAIDQNVGKPSKSTFSDPGLSVLVESSTYPLDIAEAVEESSVFVGAVWLDASLVESLGFTIHLDPYPDPLGRQQHPNHAQVVCHKSQGITKKLRDHCEWSVPISSPE